jgi:hypothetical protein
VAARSGSNVLTMKSGGSQLLERNFERKTVAAVNGMAVAATSIFTTDADLGYFAIRQIVVEVLSIPDTTQAQISIGTNAATYDNVVPLTALAFTGANRARTFGFDAAGGGVMLAAGTQLFVNVQIAGTVGGAHVFNVSVIGYYIG